MSQKHVHSLPLSGVRVLEFEALGVVPYVGMILSDLGAEVIRIGRLEPPRVLVDGPAQIDPAFDYTSRGRQRWRLDLKAARPEAFDRLIRSADVLMEGYRPGVMERLGLGPDDVFESNDSIVYARLSGLPRSYPNSWMPVHDINVLALSGVLHALGAPGAPPRLPLNLVADYGAGSLLAVAITSALAGRAGADGPQLLDLSMLGVLSTLLAGFYGLVGQGTIPDDPGVSYLDGVAPFYTTYATSDGRYLAVGAVEPRFYAEFLDLLGLEHGQIGDTADHASWPRTREVIGERISALSLVECITLFEGTSACASPVLTPQEASATDPMQRTLVREAGWVQPRPLLADVAPAALREITIETVLDIAVRWESPDAVQACERNE